MDHKTGLIVFKIFQPTVSPLAIQQKLYGTIGDAKNFALKWWILGHVLLDIASGRITQASAHHTRPGSKLQGASLGDAMGLRSGASRPHKPSRAPSVAHSGCDQIAY
jgi:hypothetical protein